jgi:hypothetical protein
MKKIKVPVKVITFVHKDTGETASFVFDENRDTSDSFEGKIFGEFYNCSGFYKASNAVVRAGHKEIVTETTIEIEIPE